MRTTTGTITATGAGSAVSDTALDGYGPAAMGVVSVSGTFTSAVVVVEKKLRGGSVWLPLSMTDEKTLTRTSGSATPTDSTTTSYRVDLGGAAAVRVYVSSGTPTDVDVEIVSGAVEEFGGILPAVYTTNTAATTFSAGITFGGATGVNLLSIPDNLANALDVTEASNSYLKFVTTNSSEQVLLSKKVSVLDDVSYIVGTGLDAEFLWSTGDADNHTAVLALDNTSQSLHITDVGAKATDWNVSANTHPNVYVHSNTTPATDYLRIGDHDGTEADIDLVGGTSLALKIAGTEYASLRATGLAVGTYVAASTAGTDQLTIKSTGTAPSGTGANVGHLYADFETDDDELFWLSGTGGTATQLTT